MIKTLMGVLVCLTGLLVLAGGGWYAFEAIRFVTETESTTGEIVDHEFTGGLNTGYRQVGSYQTQTSEMYAPIVAFRTATGIDVQFRANWSEGDPPAVGTSVPVRYSEQFPERARISGLFSLYGGAAILFLLGGVFAGAGGLILMRHPRDPA